MTDAALLRLEPDGALLTRLRPERSTDAALLSRWREQPCSPYDDFSGPPPPGVEGAGLTAAQGAGALLVTDSEDRPIGTVSWRAVRHGPTAGSQALDLGIALRPESQGRGHGTRAQRMLATYLFATTTVHRLQASTDVTNVPEQRSLARAGFRHEGVLREAQWRQGEWHDLVAYGLLRGDRI